MHTNAPVHPCIHCGSVLQCVAVCCSVCVAVCCSVLQSVCCSVWQCVGASMYTLWRLRQTSATSAKYIQTYTCAVYIDHGALDRRPQPHTHTHTHTHTNIRTKSTGPTTYGVATISRLLEFIGLFCRIQSLL